MAASCSSLQSRKDLYKHTGSWTPSRFRESLRKRCRDKLRADRDRMLTKYRGITSEGGTQSRGDLASQLVHDVMLCQWEGLRGTYGDLPSYDSSAPQRKRKWEELGDSAHNSQGSNLIEAEDELFLGEAPPDAEEMVSLFEELTKDLIREEEEILKQYEIDVLYSEEALCAALNTLATDDVICPICQKNIVHENRNVIFCSCGLRLDTGFGGVTLSYMRQQLEEGCTEHSSACCAPPQFAVDSTAGVDNLIMKCKECDFLYVIV